jgi:hypothetical protein
MVMVIWPDSIMDITVTVTDMDITMDVNDVKMMMRLLIDGNGVTHSKRSNDVFHCANLIVLMSLVLMHSTASLRLQPGTCPHSDVAPMSILSKSRMVIATLLLPIHHLT